MNQSRLPQVAERQRDPAPCIVLSSDWHIAERRGLGAPGSRWVAAGVGAWDSGWRYRHGLASPRVRARPARRPAGVDAVGAARVARAGSRWPGPRGLGRGLAAAAATTPRGRGARGPLRDARLRLGRSGHHLYAGGGARPALRRRALAQRRAPGAGSGVPYFYLSPLQLSVNNLQENPYATLTMTLAQTNFCKKHGFDPQSPLCAHIILSGTVTKVNETEMDIAKHSLFIRHPEMKTWPSSHNWFFAKLNITSIWVLDYFGGPKIVTPEEYYNVTVQ
uniref:Cellular repressor of E1A stimulateds 1 n=1 Tax=Macaca fascicularis TaxID=9541 RepID=A0A2K5VT40_MACFA